MSSNTQNSGGTEPDEQIEEALYDVQDALAELYVARDKIAKSDLDADDSWDLEKIVARAHSQTREAQEELLNELYDR